VLANESVRTTKASTAHEDIIIMAIIGYARCSTQDQDLRTQRTRLSEASCTKLFEEKESGARGDRPEIALDLLTGTHGRVCMTRRCARR